MGRGGHGNHVLLADRSVSSMPKPSLAPQSVSQSWMNEFFLPVKKGIRTKCLYKLCVT